MVWISQLAYYDLQSFEVCATSFHDHWLHAWTPYFITVSALLLVLKQTVRLFCHKEIFMNDTLQGTGWFKKMDSISYVCISWTMCCMWVIYITFGRGGPKFSNTTARAFA
jgi:hypothetical protein